MDIAVYTCTIRQITPLTSHTIAKESTLSSRKIKTANVYSSVVNNVCRVFFCLRDACGKETFKMEIDLFSTNKRGVFEKSTYKFENCLVTVPFFRTHTLEMIKVSCVVRTPVLSTPDTVMAGYLDYCRKDPESLLTFECEDGSVTGVTKLMMSRSDVIEAMMNSDCIEARTRNVKIVDFSASIVRKMIEFCESNQIKETEDDEIELYKIADKYNILLMKEFTAARLANCVDEFNVIELYQFAKTFNNDYLQEKCIKFGCWDISKVLVNARYADVDRSILKEFRSSTVFNFFMSSP